jgi:hypothetical protein
VAVPTIQVNYASGSPPVWIEPCVRRLLASLPAEYTAGIGAIVLSDRRAVGKGKTARVGGKKYPRQSCLGFYHARTSNQQAWIELVVENLVAESSKLPFSHSFWILFLQDMMIASTLYHEIGHHLDLTFGAAARTGEQAADDWSRRLRILHIRKRYWYLNPVSRLLHLARRALKKMVN